MFASLNGELAARNRLVEVTVKERDAAVAQVKDLQGQLDCSRLRLADYLNSYGKHIINGDTAGIDADTQLYIKALTDCVKKP